MADRPILMSAPMVLACLREADEPGTGKTQTRRILKDQAMWERIGDGLLSRFPRQKAGVRFAEGDRLWVRETWKPHSIYAAIKPRDVPPSRIFYACDGGSFPSNTPWRPAIYMPRWASRLTLTVSNVRVERLQAISEADAEAEGCPACARRVVGLEGGCSSYVCGYRQLWNTINGKGSWDANPWIVAVTFKPERRNIDA